MSGPGRNDPCPCGSGQKYKKCCFAKDEAAKATAASNVPKAAAEHGAPSDAKLKPRENKAHAPKTPITAARNPIRRRAV